MNRFFYYIKIGLLMSKNSFMMVFSQRLAFFIFLTGKILRFGFFLGFLFFLLNGAKSLAGYNTNQALFFFLTFNVVDVLSQFLFREVYRFRPLVVSGDFDLILTKPMSALFRVLMGGPDVIDFVTIPPLIYATYFVGKLIGPTSQETILYIFLVLNGLLIAASFHIAVLSLGIITLEIDHTIMIYRDLTSLGRFPVDIYKQPLQGILTYLIPVGIMVTFPAKALMGFVSFDGVVLSFFFGLLAVFISLRFWNYALTKYTSASS